MVPYLKGQLVKQATSEGWLEEVEKAKLNPKKKVLKWKELAAMANHSDKEWHKRTENQNPLENASKQKLTEDARNELSKMKKTVYQVLFHIIPGKIKSSG